MLNIVDRLQRVKENIHNVCSKLGKSPTEIILVAVSKTHPSEKIRELFKFGHYDFGENYVQEALKKQEELSGCDIRWHFIGRIQSNKAKYLAGNFWMIHSLDSLKVAEILNKRSSTKGITQKVLIQVNVGEEKQKAGIRKNEIKDFLQKILRLEHLRIEGLMCIPPFFEEPEKSRPLFRELRVLRDNLEIEFGIKFPYLSMGMSSDYIQAIEEGANIIRVGTDIFGPRDL